MFKNRRKRVGCKDCVHSDERVVRRVCRKGEVNISFDYWNGETVRYLTFCEEKNSDGFCEMFEPKGPLED